MSRLIISISVLSFFLFSCSKKQTIDPGIPTILKGHVADTIRRINISNYKIKLVKMWWHCADWNCGTDEIENYLTTTDNNGNYSISFNYKLGPGESYATVEQYYGLPYYHEYSSGSGTLEAGKTNILNYFSWEPVRLSLTITVSNNNKPPLMVRTEYPANNRITFATEDIFELSTTKTVTLKTRPNSDINIIFWYYTGPMSSPVIHQKSFAYRTTQSPVTSLNYNIDCSTF